LSAAFPLAVSRGRHETASGKAADQVESELKKGGAVAVPQVAIVGRPNVGKSSLFNWLAGRRIAIVDPTAGTTRDRVTTLVQAGDQVFELVDTGGMGVHDADGLTADVERQIQHAIDEAALVLFVVDARAGLTPHDQDVAARLRGIDRPILLVVNKCDTPELEQATAEFFQLGFDQPMPVSAQQNRGKGPLLAAVGTRLADMDSAGAATAAGGEPVMKLAIVGRRNTGKSTFINCLARSERVIVSEVAGTTRDSVDVRFERNGEVFLAIDTAGVRKKGSVQTDIEFYSLHRAQRSIRRADVALLFLDAHLKVSRVDKQLADYILEQHKPAIFVVNKWDLAGDLRTGQLGDYLRKVFPMLDYVPMAFVSAKDGKNIHLVLDLARQLHQQASTRVSTGDLNRVLRWALEQQAPPLRQNRRPKIYYATQVAANPPTIVLFTNGPELFDNTYRRYLVKVFRDHLPFNDVPIKLYLRQRQRADLGPDIEKEPAEAPALKKKRRASRPEPELWDDV
jgi:GTP-binding protein